MPAVLTVVCRTVAVKRNDQVSVLWRGLHWHTGLQLLGKRSSCRNFYRELNMCSQELPDLKQWCSDSAVLRYLRARNWDVVAATKMLKASLEWYVALAGPNACTWPAMPVLMTSVWAEPILPCTGRRATYKPHQIRWEDIQEEAKTGKTFILQTPDKEGRPVIIMRPRQAPDDGSACLPDP